MFLSDSGRSLSNFVFLSSVGNLAAVIRTKKNAI